MGCWWVVFWFLLCFALLCFGITRWVHGYSGRVVGGLLVGLLVWIVNEHLEFVVGLIVKSLI